MMDIDETASSTTPYSAPVSTDTGAPLVCPEIGDMATPATATARRFVPGHITAVAGDGVVGLTPDASLQAA